MNQMLHEAAKAGHWLCLKNLHLVVHWVPHLEKELSALSPHPTFRLWLTTEAHAHFPAILLQQSLKITFEAPPDASSTLYIEGLPPDAILLDEFVVRQNPSRTAPPADPNVGLCAHACV